MSLFVINRESVEDNDIYIDIFTFQGEQDYDDEDGYPMLDIDEEEADDLFSIPEAYAVRITKGRKVQYYVKRGRYGRLYNPIGMYSEGNSKKQMRHAGKPEWSLQVTNKNVFNNYIKFLKTRNTAWLNNAEREI